jgi:hypothetical protein
MRKTRVLAAEATQPYAFGCWDSLIKLTHVAKMPWRWRVT